MPEADISMSIKVAPKGMGLNDFVAYEEGFFADEGVQVEFDTKTFHGTQSSWKGMDYFDRPQDKAAEPRQKIRRPGSKKALASG